MVENKHSINTILSFGAKSVNPEILEQLLTGRADIADFFEQKITAIVEEKTNQFWLIVGQRGMGKTHLLKVLHSRVWHYVEENRLVIAYFAEEEYGVANFFDFLLRILNSFIKWYDNDSEFLKSELEKLNIKYQIQFTSLHVERAEIIKSIYNLLYDYKIIIHDVMHNELDNQNPIEHLKQKLNCWSEYAICLSEIFHKNKIFFSIRQVDLINKIHLELNRINEETKKFFVNNRNITENINSIFNENIEFIKLRNDSTAILEKVMVLEKELEVEFRKHLGVDIK